MNQFLTQHQSSVKGVISGWDRIRFRGTIRWLATLHGMASFLRTIGVLLVQFRSWAMQMTAELKNDAAQLCEREGLICVITCVESCQTAITALLAAQNASTKQLVQLAV